MIKSSKDNPMIIARSIYHNVPKDMIRKVYALGFLDMDHTKTKEKSKTLRDRIMFLSENTQEFTPEEWEITGAEYCQNDSACICGQTGIKNRYILTNKHTKISISIGGNCFKKHFNAPPEEELISFSKSHGEPYVWLGRKYDTFIFSVLGFKNAYLYFKCRAQKKEVPLKHNQQLMIGLSKSIYAFNFLKWRVRLTRGQELLKRIQKNKLKHQFSKRSKDSASQSNTSPLQGIITQMEKVLAQANAAMSIEDIELLKQTIKNTTHIIDISKKNKASANRLKTTKAKQFNILLESTISKRKKLSRRLSHLCETNASSKKKKKVPKRYSIEDDKWVQVLIEASDDKVNHPEGSDFHIMGTFIKQRLEDAGDRSARSLIVGARKHLRETREKENPVEVENVEYEPQRWEASLVNIAEDDSLGKISMFAKKLLQLYNAEKEGMSEKQRALLILSHLKREKVIFSGVGGKGENGETSHLIISFIDVTIKKILEENTWILESRKLS